MDHLDRSPKKERDTNQPLLELVVPSDFKRQQLDGALFGDNLDDLVGHKAIDIFSRAGFDIRFSDDHYQRHPGALGLYVDSLSFENNRSGYRSYLRQLADQHGIASPLVIDWRSILHYDLPVVAKNRAENGGKGKFLLSSESDKLRFLSLQRYLPAMAWNTYPTAKLARSVPSECEQLRQALYAPKDQLSPRQSKLLAEIDAELETTEFEEFIGSESDRNISYRVLADAAGEIHYCLLLHKRAKPLAPADSLAWDDDPTDMVLLNRARCRTPLQLALIYLTHPRSPFKLDQPLDIVSNQATGGEPIIISSLLGATPSYSPHQREILASQGFDPNRPQLPKQILEQATAISRALRYEFPYGGIDFIRDSGGRFLFLEWNQLPGLCFEALGLPSDTDDIRATLSLLERVAERFSAAIKLA